MEHTQPLLDSIINGIQEKKGRAIDIIDLRGIDGAVCRHFVVCEGGSPAQVEAIAESIGEVARRDLGEKPVRVAGMEQALWVAMDYVDVMVHVFLPDVRAYYDLEHLWADAPITRIPDLD